jgi:hypothetical protein
LLDRVDCRFLRVAKRLDILAGVAVPTRCDSLDTGRRENANVVDQAPKRDLVLRKPVTLGVDAHAV